MEIQELLKQYSQAGKVVAISVRPKRLEPTILFEQILAVENKGLEGDRSKGGNRQVTLIQKEHIQAIASFLGKTDLDFTLMRRNISCFPRFFRKTQYFHVTH
jgi:MOSC domain-containing protein YiiM